MMTIVLSKRNGFNFLLHAVEDYDGSYEGNRIPMTDQDLLNMAKFLNKYYDSKCFTSAWLNRAARSEKGYLISKAKDATLYGKFQTSFNNKLVYIKQHQPDAYKKTIQNKVPCDTNGKWKLIRSASKDEIHIGARKDKTEKHPNGVSWINSVCITDTMGKAFFDAADDHNVPIGTKHYLTAANGSIFYRWSRYMNDEYYRQLNAHKKKDV